VRRSRAANVSRRPTKGLSAIHPPALSRTCRSTPADGAPLAGAKRNLGSLGRVGQNQFARVHQALRVTPAMAAGVTDHVWEIEEIVGLINA